MEQLEAFTNTQFSIVLPKFEGYFEALLDLIEKETLSILDISLTAVTAQYLEYYLSENLNAKCGLSNGSEFIVICSYLIELKSKRILPEDKDEETEEIELSLIDHISQYKIFKIAANDLKDRKELFSKIYHRSKLEGDFVYEKKYYLKDVSPFDLTQALRRILKDVEARGESIEIIDEIVTVEEKIAEIKNKILNAKDGMIFDSLFTFKTRIEVIVTFLALLELIRQKCVIIKQIDLFDSIVLFPVNILKIEAGGTYGNTN